MLALHEPQAVSFFGNGRQKRVMSKLLQHCQQEPTIILEYGPTKSGKTISSRYWHKLCQQPASLIFVPCNQHINQGDFADVCYTVHGFVEQHSFNPLRKLLLVLDEADIVGIRRGKTTLTSVSSVVQVMALLDTVMDRRNVSVILCTNVPNILDDALLGRCPWVIYIPPPGADVIKDALVHRNYTLNQAVSVSQELVSRMQLKGWCLGDHLLQSIVKHAGRLKNESPARIADEIYNLTHGPRIDRLHYERENQRWQEAWQRTAEQWDPSEDVPQSLAGGKEEVQEIRDSYQTSKSLSYAP